jgi:heme-degrading monooxygenase HmoA
MIAIMWEFRIRAESAQAFVEYYSGRGRWAQLFSRAEGYRGTDLLRDSGDPLRFVTIDRWDSAEDFSRFKSEFAADYAALDALCEHFTVEERFLGEFQQDVE